jgi:hypothetical protein
VLPLLQFSRDAQLLAMQHTHHALAPSFSSKHVQAFACHALVYHLTCACTGLFLDTLLPSTIPLSQHGPCVVPGNTNIYVAIFFRRRANDRPAFSLKCTPPITTLPYISSPVVEPLRFPVRARGGVAPGKLDRVHRLQV